MQKNKMKQKNRYYFVKVLVLIFMLIGITVIVKRFEKIRPITIKIIDKKTQKPVENIFVTYGVKLLRDQHFLGIPLVETYTREKGFDYGFTDSNGEVQFENNIIWFRLYEIVLEEMIHINIGDAEAIRKMGKAAVTNKKVKNFYEGKSGYWARVNLNYHRVYRGLKTIDTPTYNEYYKGREAYDYVVTVDTLTQKRKSEYIVIELSPLGVD